MLKNVEALRSGPLMEKPLVWGATNARRGCHDILVGGAIEALKEAEPIPGAVTDRTALSSEYHDD
jgi:hypothetical protein